MLQLRRYISFFRNPRQKVSQKYILDSTMKTNCKWIELLIIQRWLFNFLRKMSIFNKSQHFTIYHLSINSAKFHQAEINIIVYFQFLQMLILLFRATFNNCSLYKASFDVHLPFFFFCYLQFTSFSKTLGERPAFGIIFFLLKPSPSCIASICIQTTT